MSPTILTPETTVPDAMKAAGGIPAMFNAHRTFCVGCSLARFCTLADVARIYGLSLEPFLAELNQSALAETTQNIGARHEKLD